MSSDENDDGDADLITHLLPLHHQDEPEPTATSTETSQPAATQMQHHQITSINSAILIRQLPSEGLSFQLWPAATTLVALLDHHRSNPTSSPLSAPLSHSSTRRLRILELGSGTGFVGISAAAILGADVTVTDLGHVVPNLRFNIAANSNVLAANGGSVEAAELSWGNASHIEAVGREFDVILGSDVVYHDHLYEPLIQTLKYVLINGGGADSKEVVFLMAHLKRWKKESAFFKKAKKLFNVQALHTDSPSDGRRVGVVVYQFLGKQ